MKIDTNTDTLASRLRAAREARGLGQEQLAYLVKAKFPAARITQQNIASIEKGKHKTTGYVAELADTLEIYTDWLALGTSPRDRGKKVMMVDDDQLVIALKLMEPLPREEKARMIKIIDAAAKPVAPQHPGKKTGNG